MNSHVFKLIKEEKQRQRETVNLIASENYASQEVLKATGSVLTNKYAEGYPSKRYYSGCKIIDQIESHAISLGRKLFQADHVNVQPHSGSQANMAVYFSQLKTGDTILAMSLTSGGHLTHGHKINFSGKLFNFIPYNVSPEDECIDYNGIEALANQHRPKMIVAGASAYSRTIDFKKIATIAQNSKTFLFIDMAHIAGLVATGLHPNPIPVADFVSSTTHKTLRGPRGGLICCKAEYGKVIDKNIMPGIQGGPLMHTIAAKAVAFEEALTPEFKKYQAQVIKNSQAMCKTLQDLGYHIVSGGTDNHLFLINLKKSNLSLTGNVAEMSLEKCNITTNRNSVPFDTESPMKTSGIRIGTPAITTRGFKGKEAIQVAHWIDEAIKKHNNEQFLETIKKEVMELCKQFPIY